MTFETDKTRQIINQAAHIVLTAHIRPDGDAICSTLALCRWLKTQGKDTTVILPNAYPEYYSWMPGIRDIVVFETETEKATQLIREAELIFCVDYNTLGRLSAARPIVEQNKNARRIVIDHHIGPEIECDVLLSEPEAAAACELVYRFINELDGNDARVDKATAELLLSGILTDTGGLSYSSNDPELYTVIAALIAKGVDKDAISRKVFHNYTVDRFRLMSHCISSMEILPDGHTALIVLTDDIKRRFNFRVGDSEGIVNLPLQIKEINRSIFVRQDKEHINVSLRSEGDVTVNTIAMLFGGGGHKNASGFESELPVKELVERIKRVLH